jgi:hypothetical protein
MKGFRIGPAEVCIGHINGLLEALDEAYRLAKQEYP